LIGVQRSLSPPKIVPKKSRVQFSVAKVLYAIGFLQDLLDAAGEGDSAGLQTDQSRAFEILMLLDQLTTDSMKDDRQLIRGQDHLGRGIFHTLQK
jgi:hypothetical protein